MVKVYDENGKHIFNEPPYTWEEEQAFYRRVGGGPRVTLGWQMRRREFIATTLRLRAPCLD